MAAVSTIAASTGGKNEKNLFAPERKNCKSEFAHPRNGRNGHLAVPMKSAHNADRPSTVSSVAIAN